MTHVDLFVRAIRQTLARRGHLAVSRDDAELSSAGVAPPGVASAQLPRDDREVMQRVARRIGLPVGRPERILGLHPELLAGAANDELDRIARRMTRRSHRLAGNRRALRVLRRAARFIRDVSSREGAPYAVVVRRAAELDERDRVLPPPGRFRDFLADACSEDAYDADPAIGRFLDRVGSRLGPADRAELLHDRGLLSQFVRGEDAICIDHARCGVCELFRETLCEGVDPSEAEITHSVATR